MYRMYKAVWLAIFLFFETTGLPPDTVCLLSHPKINLLIQHTSPPSVEENMLPTVIWFFSIACKMGGDVIV